MRILSLLSGLCLLLFIQCGTAPVSSENINREWMLVEFQDFSKQMLTSKKASINLTGDTAQNGAFMGCNRMFFSADFKKDATAKFSDIGSTMMYCEDAMKLESAFSKALPTMTKYQIVAHHLTLSNGKGEQMKFVAADWD